MSNKDTINFYNWVKRKILLGAFFLQYSFGFLKFKLHQKGRFLNQKASWE